MKEFHTQMTKGRNCNSIATLNEAQNACARLLHEHESKRKHILTDFPLKTPY